MCRTIAIAMAYSTSPRCITVKTTSILPRTTPEDLHNFLASPGNWPKIVASSHSVDSPNGKNLNEPLLVSEEVNEVFGLPPILLLSVSWKCVKSIEPNRKIPGSLEFYSQEGVSGFASACQMKFDITELEVESGFGGSEVQLQMEYEPLSPLAVLAVPALIIDNTIALRLLLPSVLFSLTASPLNKYRQLMGSLYGIAGAAHLIDCLTNSQLLVLAGSQPFQLLPPFGKAYALLWCAAGPLSFVASRIGGKVADLGLIGYGIIEVIGAGLIVYVGTTNTVVEAMSLDTISTNPLGNAIFVQGIVAAAWLYSFQRKDNPDLTKD